MVARVPTIHLLIKGEQREVDHPQEVELIRRDLQFAERHQFPRRIQANFAKDFTGVQPFIGSKENEVALFDFQLLLQGRLFGFTENFTIGDFHSPLSTLM